jgi:hypothetical protein
MSNQVTKIAKELFTKLHFYNWDDLHRIIEKINNNIFRFLFSLRLSLSEAQPANVSLFHCIENDKGGGGRT